MGGDILSEIKYYIRIYFMIVSQYIKSRMQFRADFYVSTFAMLIFNLSGILSLWVVFTNIPQLEGWNFYELCFLYSFTMLALCPLQILFDNVWQLNNHVRNGSFIKYYFKPLNMLFYYMSEVFDLKGLGQIVLGVGALLYSSSKLGLDWSVFKIALLVLAILSSSLIMISIMIISASLSFWIINSHAVTVLLFRFRDYSYYPMSIFGKSFRAIFTFIIPIGFISYYPSQIFLRSEDVGLLTVISPLIGIVMFVIAYAVWNKGTRSFSGTGS